IGGCGGWLMVDEAPERDQQMSCPEAGSMRRLTMRAVSVGRAVRAAAVLAVAATAAACGGGSTSSSSSGGGASIPSGLSVSSFDASFSFMSKLAGLTAAGHGLVGVIL